MVKKRILIILMLITLLCFGKSVEAKTISKNLNDTVAELIETFDTNDLYIEQVKTLKKANVKKIDEKNPQKINVYVFREKKCAYCLKELTYLTTLNKEYGNKINVITYDVNANKDNYNLWKDVAYTLNGDTKGVPFMVIGKIKMIGFSEKREEQVKKIIDNEYNKDNRYDVMNNLKHQSKKAEQMQKKEEKKDYTKQLKNIFITTLVIIQIIIDVHLLSKNKTKKKVKKINNKDNIEI